MDEHIHGAIRRDPGIEFLRCPELYLWWCSNPDDEVPLIVELFNGPGQTCLNIDEATDLRDWLSRQIEEARRSRQKTESVDRKRSKDRARQEAFRRGSGMAPQSERNRCARIEELGREHGVTGKTIRRWVKVGKLSESDIV